MQNHKRLLLSPWFDNLFDVVKKDAWKDFFLAYDLTFAQHAIFTPQKFW